MTNDEIRIAVGELCCPHPRVEYFVGPPDGKSGCLFDESKRRCAEWLAEQKVKFPDGIQKDYAVHSHKIYPNYVEDLNAASEMEATISDEDWPEYERYLRALTLHEGVEGEGLCKRMIRATARQRCVSLIRLKGKWVEESK